jgi:hypothetical protein
MKMRQPSTAGELEIWLRDRLRAKLLYDRIRSISIVPLYLSASGWTADVEGDMSNAETVHVRTAIAELQRIYSLTPK